jgi:hypothetical protein
MPKVRAAEKPGGLNFSGQVGVQAAKTGCFPILPYFTSNGAIPGNFLPSQYSRLAPPPVET